MEYINKVEISGNISEIRRSEKGSCFLMIKQIIKVNDLDFKRLFEVFVDSKKTSILSIIKEGLDVKIIGSLTVFRIKGTKFHKIVINAEEVQLL